MGEGREDRSVDGRGWSQLVVDAVVGITDLVESMHQTVRTLGGLVGGGDLERTSGLTGVVYDGIRTTASLFGRSVETILVPFTERLEEVESSEERDMLVAALNGVVGDHLADTDNPLATEMHLRWRGERLTPEVEGDLRSAVDEVNGRVLVMVHGSGCCEHQWTRDGHNHGLALAESLGFVPLFLRYNSGRHISQNGEALAELLEATCQRLPNVTEVVLFGHSMGGLVARSAIHYGESFQHSWRPAVSSLVCLASPHHGAALERYGNLVDRGLEVSPYSAPFARLGRIRSAGVTDLRYGSLCHEDWRGRSRFEAGPGRPTHVPLPSDVDCYVVAGSLVESASDIADRVVGDGLVSLASAFGQRDEPDRRLAFPEAHRRVVRGCGHMQLLGDSRVYETLEGWLGAQGPR